MNVFAHVECMWNEDVLEALRRHIKIPALSQDFDPDWFNHKHIADVVDNAFDWLCATMDLDAHVEVFQDYDEGNNRERTPLLFIDIPARGDCTETVLFYGHLDKQPEMEGWDEARGLAPWKPVDIKDAEGHRLYGRGGADDGYAVFAAVTSILALEREGIPHARCVLMIETGEESGSPDLPYYLEKLRERIGTPSLVIALDSGCGDYKRLWMTTSLRGVIYAELEVRTLTEGVHSGDAGGIVPDSFRVVRKILEQLENSTSGDILLPEFHTGIPTAAIAQAKVMARVVGQDFLAKFPWLGTAPIALTDSRLADRILDRTWRPSLTVTGADGLPPVEKAGNVLRPFTRVKLSIRIPPLIDVPRAVAALEQKIRDTTVPASVEVSCKVHGRNWWMSPTEAEWLTQAVDQASQECFGLKAERMGEGGAIPFMSQLTDAFPDAQFVITGVLGPGSNAHGPNEFLHIDYAKRLTATLAQVLGAHARQFAVKE